MVAADRGSHLEKIATSLTKVVEKNLKDMVTEGYRDSPTIKKRNIIEYEGRLRASGMDIFNRAMYISYVCYYPSPKAMDLHHAAGTIILYLQRASAEGLLKALGYHGVDDEKEEEMMKTCGEFCGLLAKEFQTELNGMGYPELIATSPESYLNSVPLGIDFNKEQYDLYEISYPFKGQKALVLELTMAPPSHAK